MFLMVLGKSEPDRQAMFERELMDENAFGWKDDWYISSDVMEAIGVAEYYQYEMDCYEVGIENAE